MDTFGNQPRNAQTSPYRSFGRERGLSDPIFPNSFLSRALADPISAHGCGQHRSSHQAIAAEPDDLAIANLPSWVAAPVNGFTPNPFVSNPSMPNPFIPDPFTLEPGMAFNFTGATSLLGDDNLLGQIPFWLADAAASDSDGLPVVLNLDTTTLATEPNTPILQLTPGTLGADTFTYDSSIRYSVYSGNGNVDFGWGGRDVLDLSTILSTSVTGSLASATRGGVLFNPGNGTRVFDQMQLNNGNQILFEGMDEIHFADGIVDLSITPNDPGFESQWNLHMMGVQNAWRFTTGSEQVVIGVQDTGLGVDWYGEIHPDLRSDTYVFGNNFSDDFESGLGSESHGTAVQGIIAAASNNGFGMSGINWNSDVLHIDVLGGDRRDLELSEATQAMIDEANYWGDRLVINMSLGIPHSGGRIGYEPAFERLVANNPDVLFVVASGNDNENGISYPASLAQLYSNVMAVGASWGNQDVNGIPKAPGTRISYPGRWGSNYGNGLTLMGPSEVIAPSATAGYYDVYFGFETQFNGTSAATPNVTGVECDGGGIFGVECESQSFGYSGADDSVGNCL